MRPKKDETRDEGAKAGESNIEFVRRLIHTPLSGGLNLLQLTTFAGVSYWWNVDANFYESVLNQTSYRPPRGLKRVFPRLYRRFGGLTQFLYDLSLRKLSHLLSRGSNPKKGVIVLLTQDVEWRRIRDYDAGGYVKTDAFFHNIIKKLSEYALVSSYPLDVSIPGGFKVALEKRTWFVPHHPTNQYWGIGTWLTEREARRNFAANWDKIADDPKLKSLCQHQGRDLYPVVRDKLESIFLYVLPQAVKIHEVSKKMFADEKTSLLLLQNEYGWRERSSVVAAKELEIPVLAIQHGIIIPGHKGYMYRRDEVSPQLSVSSQYCPLPDYTAVFGESYRDLLIEESAYPSGRVVVTGSPRYDHLINAGKIYNRAGFSKKYGVAKGQKLVLWATQSHSLSDEENMANIEAILRAADALGGVTIIIKQHPAEAPRYTKILQDAASRHGGKVIIVPKDSDTYEQLYACDLLITKNSTTAVEAVALGKPVIVLNLGGTPDAVDYVAEGVAVGVYSLENLTNAITTLLVDDSVLAAKRPGYISRNIYRGDGRASERVAELVKRIIREGPKGNTN